MRARGPAPLSFARVAATLAVYTVAGPLIGTAFGLLILVPLAMLTFGSGIAAIIGAYFLSNPWLPYFYGLLPAAATGILLVLREAIAGRPRLLLVAAIGLLAGLVAGYFTFGQNPYLVGVFAVSCLVAALGCHGLLALFGRGRP
ncbi:hypothetical protein C3941_16940 [Kaistia algarum]|uniref:hypothetical protein n=1 Tax=Kaistia algarum TaxID=2083279 RepID=UPI000CE82382|nr:hypothetical protein [Kaistia algarum]MCX5516351.1 hypothetical protein [Kaistia algarum]PPE78732.1 hypothetical protein C3941_16940 [Kaistia algarum]